MLGIVFLEFIFFHSSNFYHRILFLNFFYYAEKASYSRLIISRSIF